MGTLTARESASRASAFLGGNATRHATSAPETTAILFIVLAVEAERSRECQPTRPPPGTLTYWSAGDIAASGLMSGVPTAVLGALSVTEPAGAQMAQALTV